MNQPCEKTEVINIIRDDLKEVKGDVKQLLVIHYENVGKSKLRTKIIKETLRFVGIVATIIGYLKYK